MIYISLYSGILPIAFFLLFFKQTRADIRLWIISFYVVQDFCIGNILSNQNLDIEDSLKKVLYSLTTILEYFSFISFLFFCLHKRKVKVTLVVASVAFFTYSVIHYTQMNENLFDSFPVGIETILILSFSFAFLYEQINTPTTVFIYNDFRFWIILGFMVYLSGSFFIFIFENKIPIHEREHIWSLTYVFNIVKNVLFSVGILVFFSNKPTLKHHVTKPNAKQLSDIT